ncbi:ABC transporter, ATP-binding/permease protein [Streptococcus infantarius subsp. infantarius]|uniref:ABC transporter ATP-binding protein n=1 Tax=Streptococcus sp. TaxID=1306 RepID=UPI000EC88A06|nr:ABC transporter ATP-binding protein [Streptococcus sp.]MCO4539221.1 ABC transporter, ATP-binding/permease protein [Streptococcus infantarius subsp. infantarius]MCO4543301.1 ABC transporter, ATP-binding/permease protein [Streptococcus infantarius subsp. infantarius]MCO4549526.1 ABC transporter, ATP-binding/permease protein [Streptococcus infantarius subsp. infantarius]MCO4551772.1 ABC transporter, ATP-binding/permease protein [Streptococcus infantarius subsp. infantarius]MCO4559002.1 ABC tra
MKYLSRYFKGYLKETVLGPLFKLFEASFELLVPIIIARIVDTIIPSNNKMNLVLMVELLFLFAVVGVIVAITAQYFSSKAAVGYTRQLTKDLFKKIMGLSKEDRDKLTTSSLVTRLTSDTYQIQTGINQFLRLFLRAPIIVFGAIIMAFNISSKMTIDFLVMVAILFVIVFTMSHLLNPIYASIRRATDKIVNMTRQQLEGVRVIRAFGQVDKEEREFAAANQNYTDLQLKAGRLSSLVTPLTYLVVNSTLVLVIWQGNIQIGKGLLSQGMLIALVNYLLQILTELLKMTMLVTSLNQSFISAKRITEVFEKESEDLSTELEEMTSDFAVSVSDISFTYPTAAEPSLSHIDFQLNPGDFLGVIGGIGSGKSTLVELLTHLYTPQEGRLAIFQNQKSPKTLGEWRSWVNVVPQKAELFQGTIRSNLTLGMKGDVSDETLWKALDIAQASDFVSEKEGQLDATVEAFGRNFSGGQRQRLTIARAIVQKAPLLILDDSTSALDYLTESKLLTAIHEQLSDTTLILISQRTNSLKAADKILLLDKGHQLGFASHDELLATNELYRDIHYSQHQKGKED